MRPLTTRSLRHLLAARRHASYPAKWEGLVTKELNGNIPSSLPNSYFPRLL